MLADDDLPTVVHEVASYDNQGGYNDIIGDYFLISLLKPFDIVVQLLCLLI